MKRIDVMARALIGLLVWTGCAVSTVEAEPQVTRRMVVELLSGYEYTPSKQDLEALGPTVPAVLMDVVADPDAPKYQRLRALDLLKHYPDRPEVEGFLRNVLADKASPSGFQRIAMKSLGRTAKGRAIETLKPYLSSPDVHTREAAAQALYETGDPASGAVLKGAAMKESEPYLKDSMRKMGDRVEQGLPMNGGRDRESEKRKPLPPKSPE
jgi:HEAT repeat protein